MSESMESILNTLSLKRDELSLLSQKHKPAFEAALEQCGEMVRAVVLFGLEPTVELQFIRYGESPLQVVIALRITIVFEESISRLLVYGQPDAVASKEFQDLVRNAQERRTGTSPSLQDFQIHLFDS